MAEQKEVGLLKAMNEHLRLTGETMQQFAANMKGLTPKDKQDLAEQFGKEFNLKVTVTTVEKQSA